VLPWAAFDRGQLPDAWWASRRLEDAIDSWVSARFTAPAPTIPVAEAVAFGALQRAVASLASDLQGAALRSVHALLAVSGLAGAERWCWTGTPSPATRPHP